MRPLSNKEKRELYKTIKERFGIDDKELKKSNVLYDDTLGIFIINNKVYFFKKENKIYPTIFYILDKEIELPYVIVDKGAIKHILNGADVFRPGIIEIDEKVKKNQEVLVISEDGKLLAIGIALYDYEEMKKMTKGKVIKTLHFYGDKITKIHKELQS